MMMMIIIIIINLYVYQSVHQKIISYELIPLWISAFNYWV